MLMNLKNRTLSTEKEYYQENMEYFLKKHSLHVEATPDDGLWKFENVGDNFGKFIHQF